MQISEIRTILNCEVFTGNETLSGYVEYGCASDLMSDVLSFSRPGAVLLTGLVNVQTIHTAVIADVKAVIFVRGKKPDAALMEFALQKNIPLLGTPYSMYEACGLLYKRGLIPTWSAQAAAVHARRRKEQQAARVQQYSQTFRIEGHNFTAAGKASLEIKSILKQLGISESVVQKVTVAIYEAEMNVVMYARTGTVTFEVTPKVIKIIVADQGPGIPDIDLAMQEGYSTATVEMREMGFGAGMGLPNIKKNSDEFSINSTVGVGTTLGIVININ
jgi:serine/threonine-protein kinase RsbT